MERVVHHLLSIAEVDARFFLRIHKRALELETLPSAQKAEILHGAYVAQIFSEASTRTRVSFEYAALSLGAKVINLDAHSSSLSKKESLYDTLLTLFSIGLNCFVVRSSDSQLEEVAKTELGSKIHLINAGNGICGHPTQALLDASVLMQHCGSLEGKCISILGDVERSRVARSNVELLSKLGMTIKVFGPSELLPKKPWSDAMILCSSIEEALEGVDAIMLLRVQTERAGHVNFSPAQGYTESFGLSQKRYESLNTKAWIMHPGPVNRGIEIDSELVEHEKSLIPKQVARGTSIRAAILEAVLAGEPHV